MSNGLEISEFEVTTLTELGAAVQRYIPSGPLPPPDQHWDPAPANLDAAGREKWEAEQEKKRNEALAEQRREIEDAKRQRQEAEDKFKAALDERIMRAYQQGAETAVSLEAHRAITVRGYVLLGVVAAVVAMPLIGMLLQLDPQAFGAYIAPVTGITGTIVGYWFGTVGQGYTGQVTVPPGRRRAPTT
jgi:hypothetical protein